MQIFLKSYFLCGLILLLIWGCAGSKPEGDLEMDTNKKGEDVENLFGVSEEEEAAANTQTNDEQEVLKLLGVDGGAQSTATQTNEIKKQAQQENLQDEVGQLEKQLNDKDNEIATLKNKIDEKEQKISGLESTIEKKSVSSEQSTFEHGTSGQITGDFNRDYKMALSEYENRNYKQAIQVFEELLAGNTKGSLSDNCQYWLGECYYGMGKYTQAIVEFTKVFEFNNSNKSDAAQLKIGLCHLRMGDKARAKEELERLLSDYPKSEYVGKVKSYLAKL
jgi:tol-pal system protein YbgF